MDFGGKTGVLIFFAVLFVVAIGGGLIGGLVLKHKQNKDEKVIVNNSSVKCKYCGNTVEARKAISLNVSFNITGWICHDCACKLFVEPRDLVQYMICHDNDIPNFDNEIYAKRKQKIAFIRKIKKSNEWTKKKFVFFNKKTLEIVSYEDPVLFSKIALYEDSDFAKVIKIKDIKSIKIDFHWGFTDAEYQKDYIAFENRISMGKRMAISYELFGAPGLLYEASKDIDGPSSMSRIYDAQISLRLKSGKTVRLLVPAPYQCDKGTNTFDDFIYDCQDFVDFINKTYSANCSN